MNKKLTLVIFFSWMVVFYSCKKYKDQITAEEAIAVVQSFDEGWEEKDLIRVDSVLSSDYVYFTQSGGVFIRDSLVSTAGAPSYYLHKVARTEFEVKVTGNVAIVSTRWQGKGMYRGRPFDEDQRCSITVIKQKGKVKILSEHCTPIKPLMLFH